MFCVRSKGGDDLEVAESVFPDDVTQSVYNLNRSSIFGDTRPVPFDVSKALEFNTVDEAGTVSLFHSPSRFVD